MKSVLLTIMLIVLSGKSAFADLEPEQYLKEMRELPSFYGTPHFVQDATGVIRFGDYNCFSLVLVKNTSGQPARLQNGANLTETILVCDAPLKYVLKPGFTGRTTSPTLRELAEELAGKP